MGSPWRPANTNGKILKKGLTPSSPLLTMTGVTRSTATVTPSNPKGFPLQAKPEAYLSLPLAPTAPALYLYVNRRPRVSLPSLTIRRPHPSQNRTPYGFFEGLERRHTGGWAWF